MTDSMTDDDATVARYPQAGQKEAEQRAAVAVEDISEVDLENGSSVVVPASRANSPRNPIEPESDAADPKAPRSATDLKALNLASQSASSLGTAYFMKPMPRKRGSSISSSDAGVTTDAATRLWQSLTAEADNGDVPPEAIRLEHFEIDRLIGRGGMGAVFSARDLRLNRTVALKVLAPEHTASKSSLDRFRNEARAAAKLDHENISRVHYLGGQLADGAGQPFANTALPFIALEFVEGPNVRELIRQKGPLPASDVLRIGLQLAAALRETSACGVVHRDIKPSNVIITPQGRAKLVDLGLARTEDAETSNELTVAGTTLGTFDYISPEQAKDPRTVDVRSDIYSLGCTLFHMAVGQAPYPEGTMLQKLLDHQGRVAPDARAINPRVPFALSELIKRMMSADIVERPQSADELYAEITAVAGELGVRALSGESVTITRNGHESYADEGWRRYLGWIVMASVLGLIAVFSDQITAPTPVPVRTPPDRVIESTEEQVPDEGPNAGAPIDSLELDLPEGQANPAATKAVSPPVSRPVATQPAVATTSIESSESQATAAEPDGTGASSSVTAEPLTTAMPNDGSVAVARSVGGESASRSPSDDASTVADSSTLPFLVRQRGSEVEFATLEEAITAAVDGATIEIVRGGIVGEVDRLIRIAEKSIEVIASAGLASRPVIRLTEPLTSSPTGVRLFELSSGGLLRFYDIDLEVDVPPKATPIAWDVFTLGEGCTVELDGSSVTVQNPGLAKASIFHVLSNSTETSSIASVVLDQCLVRGDTTLLRTDGQCSIEAPISEAAIAVNGPLLDLQPKSMPDFSRGSKELSIHIDESTLIVGGGSQFRFAVNEDDRISRVRVTSDDSVFALLDQQSSFVSMTGDLYEDEFKDLFTWDGSKNHFSLKRFWTTASADTEVSRQPELDFDFAAWVSHWGVNSQDEQQVTIGVVGEAAHASGDRKVSEFVVDDFAPVDSGANPIRRGVGAKRPGVPWNQLFVPESNDAVPLTR